MKYFVAILCFAQIAFSAPNEPATIVEQVQKNVASIQEQAQAAVKDLNEKVLKATGSQNNVQLLETVNTQAQAYATQVKGLTDQINQKVAEQKATADASFNSIVKQLSDSAANLLGQKDPAQVEQLQGTFNNVLTQAGALQAQLAQQGSVVQQSFADLFGKLYEDTVESAKKVATSIDASRSQ